MAWAYSPWQQYEHEVIFGDGEDGGLTQWVSDETQVPGYGTETGPRVGGMSYFEYGRSSSRYRAQISVGRGVYNEHLHDPANRCAWNHARMYFPPAPGQDASAAGNVGPTWESAGDDPHATCPAIPTTHGSIGGWDSDGVYIFSDQTSSTPIGNATTRWNTTHATRSVQLWPAYGDDDKPPVHGDELGDPPPGWQFTDVEWAEPTHLPEFTGFAVSGGWAGPPDSSYDQLIIPEFHVYGGIKHQSAAGEGYVHDLWRGWHPRLEQITNPAAVADGVLPSFSSDSPGMVPGDQWVDLLGSSDLNDVASYTDDQNWSARFFEVVAIPPQIKSDDPPSPWAGAGQWRGGASVAVWWRLKWKSRRWRFRYWVDEVVTTTRSRPRCRIYPRDDDGRLFPTPGNVLGGRATREPCEKIRYRTNIWYYDTPAYMDRRTAAHLDATRAALPADVDVLVAQGAFNVGDPASAGTHDGAACVDVAIYDKATLTVAPSGWDWWAMQRFFREQGWAAWYRYPPAFGDHIHMISLGYGDCAVGDLIPGQVSDYYNNLDGLSGHGADDTWHPDDIDATIFRFGRTVRRRLFPGYQ